MKSAFALAFMFFSIHAGAECITRAKNNLDSVRYMELQLSNEQVLNSNNPENADGLGNTSVRQLCEYLIEEWNEMSQCVSHESELKILESNQARASQIKIEIIAETELTAKICRDLLQQLQSMKAKVLSKTKELKKMDLSKLP